MKLITILLGVALFVVSGFATSMYLTIEKVTVQKYQTERFYQESMKACEAERIYKGRILEDNGILYRS